jgi:hypothetical protein
MYSPKTSDAAVRAATGKGWKQWFSLLDKAGSKTKGHKEIVEWVFSKYLGRKGANINVASSGGWWSQMVTVEYERSRGKRAVNQNTDGFLVAIHKTLPMSRKEFLKRWEMLAPVKKLVPTPTRSQRPTLRYKAKEGIVVVTMDDMPGGPGRASKLRIMVAAARLPRKALVESNRTLWRKHLNSLAK